MIEIKILDKFGREIGSWLSSRDAKVLRFVFGIYGEPTKRSYNSEQLDIVMKKACAVKLESLMVFLTKNKHFIKSVRLLLINEF